MAQTPEIKELTRLLNKANDIRQQRLAAQRAVDDMKTEEDLLTQKLTTILRAEKLEAFGTAKANVTLKRSIVPTLVDEAALLKWGQKAGNEDVLKVGVVAAAWKLRVAAGVKVPGVDTFTKESVSVTPVKAA